MDLLTLFKLNQYYPENCALIHIHNTQTGFYSAAVFKFENGQLGSIIFSLPRFDYKTGEEALEVLISVVEELKKGITAMSN